MLDTTLGQMSPSEADSIVKGVASNNDMTLLFIRAGLVVLFSIPASLLVALWLAIAFGFDYNREACIWQTREVLLVRDMQI
jgi:hypothetical protein